ncbi:MAG: hypothetical protein KDE31_37625 [Caldilineaceae bacterium]|nr:hypothetical protein [Caldilineaceae bacterium]
MNGALYGQIAGYLAREFRVVPFPYDWRRSVAENAAELATVVGRELGEATTPVHLLAHEAGGLLARAMIAANGALWQQLTKRGGRLIMAGTPHAGSYAALELLSGQAPVVHLLDLVDPKLGVAEIVKIFGSFPGLYALLPHARHTWEGQWQASPAASWIPADQWHALLDAATQLWQTIEPAIDGTHMHNIVGTAPWTPAAVALDNEQRLTFNGGELGDGRVTYGAATLPGVPTWLLDAPYGDLFNRPELFPALVELLQQGETARLTTDIPVANARSATSTRQFRPVLYPSQQ